MDYEKYLIKKGKTDLLSSLEALDKNLLKEKLEEFEVDNVNELRDCIIEDFEFTLDMSKDDIFTQMYFDRLIEHENSVWMSAYQQDIEDLLVFVYENKGHYSYYIPTELKEIIERLLGGMSEEEELNLEIATNAPIEKSLEKILATFTVKELKEIGDLFLINRLSNKPKKELAKIIYDTLTDKEKLTSVIKRFISKEFDLLKDLMSNKGTIQDNNISIETYHFLRKLGLVFLFKQENKFYVSMTDDVYTAIKKVDLNRMKKRIDENTKVYNLVRSTVELYGIFPYNDLDDYYNSYYGTDDEYLTSKETLPLCNRADFIDVTHKKHGTYFAHKLLTHKELKPVLDEIMLRQANIKRKQIKLEELLKYCDYKYYEETEAKKKFKKYLKNKDISPDGIESIIKTISDMYRLGNNFIGPSIEMLQEYGLEVTKKNSQEILNYLMEIYNNTRIWENNGWTPEEMGKNFEETKK